MRLSVIALAMVCACALSPANAANDLTATEARATVAELAAKLETGYLDPATGAAYAQTLRANAAAGVYDGFTDTDEFAAAVTEDVRAIYPDGHLRLRNYAPRDAAAQSQEDRPPAFDAPIWLEPGVAYANWRVFLGDEASIAAIDALLSDFGDAKALIFDLREHHGGGLDEQDEMFARFFRKPTHLVTMRIRRGKGEMMREAFDGMASMKRKPAENGVDIWEHWATPSGDQKRWPDIPIYLLTSQTTASAAEHFTLSLKRTGRATIIGETTKGAGNFGSGERIGERFYAFIAVGQTVDPSTGKGWDAIGIAPDVAVPAGDALDKALELIHAQ